MLALGAFTLTFHACAHLKQAYPLKELSSWRNCPPIYRSRQNIYRGDSVACFETRLLLDGGVSKHTRYFETPSSL